MDGNGDGPVSGAQDFLDLRQQGKIHIEALMAPVTGKGHFQPVEITQRLVHVGFFELDIA